MSKIIYVSDLVRRGRLQRIRICTIARGECRSGDNRQFQAGRVRPLYGQPRQRGRLGETHAPTRNLPASTIRPSSVLNRDTLYSSGVFDLDAGPVTITMPDAGRRLMSLQVINEDHYVPAVYYGPGRHTPHAAECPGHATSSPAFGLLVDPNDPADLAQVHALQDAIKVSQKRRRQAGTADVGSRRAKRAFVMHFWC